MWQQFSACNAIFLALLQLLNGSKMEQTFLSNSCALQHETPSMLPALIQYAFISITLYLIVHLSSHPQANLQHYCLPQLTQLL